MKYAVYDSIVDGVLHTAMLRINTNVKTVRIRRLCMSILQQAFGRSVSYSIRWESFELMVYKTTSNIKAGEAIVALQH